tara:strand:+ start:1126 stop:1713 length:588 start_codon:yes stop_codon:yes gene_type:complete
MMELVRDNGVEAEVGWRAWGKERLRDSLRKLTVPLPQQLPSVSVDPKTIVNALLRHLENILVYVDLFGTIMKKKYDSGDFRSLGRACLAPLKLLRKSSVRLIALLSGKEEGKALQSNRFEFLLKTIRTLQSLVIEQFLGTFLTKIAQSTPVLFKESVVYLILLSQEIMEIMAISSTVLTLLPISNLSPTLLKSKL